MCSSLTFLLISLLIGSVATLDDDHQPVGDSDYVIISDGNELRLHSRSSRTTSAELGIKSKSKITSLDYYYSSNNSVTIVWIDSTGENVNLDTVDLVSRKVVNNATFGSQLLSNITSVAVLRSESGNVIVTSHDDGQDQGRITASNFGTMKDCVWVAQVKKPGQVVSGSSALGFLVIWVSDNTCVEGLSIQGRKKTIVCLEEIQSDPSPNATLESVAVFQRNLFVIVSSGQVFRGDVFSKKFVEVTTQEYSSALKMDRGYKNIELVEGMNGTELFVSNLLHGEISKVIVSKEWKALKSTVWVIERSLFDFKILRQNDSFNFKAPFDTCLSSDHKSKEEKQEEEIIEIIQIIVAGTGNPSSDYQLDYLGTSCLVILSVVIVFLGALCYQRKFGRSQVPSRMSSEEPVIRVSADKCISIEDLGGFANPGFENKSWMGQVRGACDSCDYKGECAERGMCLNTFRLLNHAHT